MDRRSFTQAMAASMLAAQDKGIRVALLTNAAGPHLPAYLEGLAKTEEVSEVYLSDPDERVKSSARQVLGAKLVGTFRGPEELFAKHKPALALVTLEALLAPPAIQTALSAGCHILAEKPACTKLADFEVLVRRAEEAKRSLVLALANRVDPVILEMRRIVQSGEIGRPYGINLQIVADQTRLTNASYHQSWIAQKSRAGGGHLIWLGIHWLDLATYVSGLRIREVAALTANVGRQPIDTEDSAVVALAFDDGVLGTLTSGYYLDRGYHSLLKIWGSSGWASLQRHTGKPPLEWYSRGQLHGYQGATEPSGYTPFVRSIARAAAGFDRWPLDAKESLYALRSVFAAYRSAESGKRELV